jgi:hypothetical protein
VTAELADELLGRVRKSTQRNEKPTRPPALTLDGSMQLLNRTAGMHLTVACGWSVVAGVARLVLAR